VGFFGWFKPDVDKLERKGDVEGLIRALDHKDKDIRVRAAQALGRVGDDRAVDPLIQAMKVVDLDYGVAHDALMGIGEKGVEALSLVLRDGDPRDRVIAALTLGDIGSVEGVEALIEALKDEEPVVRGDAAMALGRIGDERAAGPLMEVLGDWDREVRLKAVEALGEIGSLEAVDPLIPLLKDQSGDVKRYAAEALGRLGDKRAVEPLVKALGDEDIDVRSEAARALGEIGDVRGVEPLTIMLKAKHVSLRNVAVDALVKIGAPVVDGLIQILEGGEGYARLAAADALEKIGWEPGDAVEKAYYYIVKERWGELPGLGEAAIGPVSRAVKDGTWTTKQEAIRALREIGGAKAVEALIEALGDENSFVRCGAAEALGKTGDRRAVDPLIEALNDREVSVRRCALGALGGIGDPKASELVIDRLIMNPWEVDVPQGVDLWAEALRNLLGGYAIPVLKASSSIRSKAVTTWEGSKYSHGEISYDLGESDDAVRDLCGTSTRVSSNILHRISQRRDVQVQTSWSCDFAYYGTLSFARQRKMAGRELERRGSPAYDPSAYLEEGAWELSE